MSTPANPEAPVETLLARARFDAAGLVTVVAVDALDGEVRMVAHANAEALERTLRTGEAHFWSRSRGELWRKGATSGHTLAVRAVLLDCDGDAVVYQVDPAGPSCHTGAPSCFFREAVDGEGALREGARPAALLARLEAVLEARKSASAGSSYTRKLLDGGPALLGAKLREEADELARAVASEGDERVAEEAADLLFHALVALRSRDVPLRAALAVLARRFGVGGLDEKAARAK